MPSRALSRWGRGRQLSQNENMGFSGQPLTGKQETLSLLYIIAGEKYKYFKKKMCLYSCSFSLLSFAHIEDHADVFLKNGLWSINN